MEKVFIAIISECLTRIILRDVTQGYFRRYFLDLISSIEVCMIAWETITVFEEYQSLTIFGTILYLNLLSKAYRYNILAGVSCPYTLIQSYIFFFRNKVDHIRLKIQQYLKQSNSIILKIQKFFQAHDFHYIILN